MVGTLPPDLPRLPVPPSMRQNLLQRALLVVGPAVILAGLVIMTLWGDNGLTRRHALQEELQAANADLGRIQAENQRLLRDLKVLERDPIAIERKVADELHWAPQGAVLYTFQAEER